MKRDLISIYNLTRGEIEFILNKTVEIKENQKRGKKFTPLAGRTLGMIFHKPSARTRVSFEVGMFQLGGHALLLSESEIGMGTRESVFDLGQTLSRYLDVIMIRTFSHQLVIDLAKAATIPVINGLTDFSHPCQVLSDLFTLYEKRGPSLNKLKIAYVGDGNNVCHSWLFAAGKLGLNLWIATPRKYAPNEEVVKLALADGEKSDAKIILTDNVVEAVKDADVIYTDVWASMGKEQEREERKVQFIPYQVNKELIQHAKPDVLIMHCLPAHRGEEITDEVIDGPNSIVFDQAENRLHTQKAILCWLLGC